MTKNLSFSLDFFTFQWLWQAMDNFWAMLGKILMFLPNLVVEIAKDIWVAIAKFWAQILKILMFLPNLVAEKSKELWLVMENFWAQILKILAFLPNLVMEKSKDLWVVLENFWAQILKILAFLPNLLVQKGKQLWLVMENFWDQILAIVNTLVQKMEFLPNLMVEKSKQLWLDMENFWPKLLAGLNMLVEKMKFFAKDLWMKLVKADLWGRFTAWFDRVVPPEKRPELMRLLLHVALPILLLLAAAFLCFRCGFFGGIFEVLKSCCRAIFEAVKSCCRAICGVLRSCFGVAGKMMKAPGKPGVVILRSVFEANPAKYFQDLRCPNPIPTGIHLC